MQFAGTDIFTPAGVSSYVGGTLTLEREVSTSYWSTKERSATLRSRPLRSREDDDPTEGLTNLFALYTPGPVQVSTVQNTRTVGHTTVRVEPLMKVW